MPLRVSTWNVNGLRAAGRKGLSSFLRRLRPDVIMLQEIRCTKDQAKGLWKPPSTLRMDWHPAERLGYSGTASLHRGPREVIGRGLGPIAGGDAEDEQGRVLRTRFAGVEFVNVYLPSGSSSEEAQARKDRWMETFLPWATELAAQPHPVIIGGDLNIAPTADDIWNPSGNKATSGFLPHEREWFGHLLDAGWTDLVRTHVGEGKGPYSWWSNRGRARELDRGWRIDHLLGNHAAAGLVLEAGVMRQGGLEVSDHAPVNVVLDWASDSSS